MVTKKEQILELRSKGKSPEDIAKEVGTSVGSVKSTISRGKNIINKGTFEKINKEFKSNEEFESVQSVQRNVETNSYDMSKLIPLHDGYIPRKLYGTTDLKILENLYNKRLNTMVVGETGTGKTHAVRNLCFMKKLPYKRISLNGATTPEELIGQLIPSNNGDLVWVDGWVTRMVRYGGVLVLDEINACPPEILFVLQSLTDGERTLTLTQNDGEIIKAHKDLWIVCTMNPSDVYIGTKSLNQSFRDRFEVIEWDYDENVERKLGISEHILKVANQLRKMYKEGEFQSAVSTRALLQFEKNVQNIGKIPAREIFFNKFSNNEDRSIVKEVFELSDPTGFVLKKEENKEGDDNDSN